MPNPGKSVLSSPVILAALVVIGIVVFIFHPGSSPGGGPSGPSNGPSGGSPGPSGAPAAAAPTWTTFQDPYEQAFTVEVPKGWTLEGGLDRVGFDDFRFMIDLYSPDRQTNVRLGDVSIPTYALPSREFPTVGQVANLGLEAQMVVANYRTGPVFAALYARGRFYKICPNPVANAADVNFSIPDYRPDATSGPQSSIGRIAYSCNSGQKIVYAEARTTLGSNIWNVSTLASFIAPASQLSLARTVLLHMAQTFKISPAWVNYQTQMDVYGAQYIEALNEQRMAQLSQQVQGFEQKMQQEQAQFDSMDTIISGITPTVDPLTGQQMDVWSGAAGEYWVDSQGNVVNSNSMPTGGQYTQLQVQTP